MPRDLMAKSHERDAISYLVAEAKRCESLEQRQEARYPFVRPVTIALEDGGSHRSVYTRDISRRGVGLLHEFPLETGELTLTVQNKSDDVVTIPTEIVWCRSFGAHWYLSGGRFLDLAANGDSAAAELDDLANIISGESADARHQPDRSFMSDQESMCSGQEILNFVQRTIDRIDEEYTNSGVENRSEKRRHVALPVTATPFNERLEPVGDSFYAVTRDISSRGIAMFNGQTVGSPFVALELVDPDRQKLKAVMKVLRCRPIGRFYEIVGKFVTKITS